MVSPLSHNLIQSSKSSRTGIHFISDQYVIHATASFSTNNNTERKEEGEISFDLGNKVTNNTVRFYFKVKQKKEKKEEEKGGGSGEVLARGENKSLQSGHTFGGTNWKYTFLNRKEQQKARSWTGVRALSLNGGTVPGGTNTHLQFPESCRQYWIQSGRI